MSSLLAPLPVYDSTRRQFLIGGLATGLLVAGCGDDNDDPASSGDGASATLSVTNEFGTFEVPAEPQRVVGLEGRRDLEVSLALRLGIVGIGSNALTGGQLAPFIDLDPTGIEVIEQAAPNLETITALRPDLILTRDSNIEQLRDKLAVLAPLVPVGGGPDGNTWRAELEQVATDLRRIEQVSGPLRTFDEMLGAVRDRHHARIESATVGIVLYEGVASGLSTSSADGFYLQAHVLGDLGGNHLPFLENFAQDESGIASFSLERTGELGACDAILLIVNDGDLRTELEGQPLWQRLPAVQAGRVVATDFRTNYGSVFAATACLVLLDQLYSTLG